MNIKEIQHELLTQDNWSTAHPYWVIREYTEVVVPENTGDVKGYRYYNNDACESYEEDEVKQELRDEDIEFDENNFEDVAEEYNYEKYYYSLVPHDEEVFLTHKGAEEYFKSRRYAYSKHAHLYCHSAYYSGELKLIQEMIKKGLFIEDEEK